MRKTTVDAVVIGAGPAGLACAMTLAKHGLAKIVITEKNPLVGVQDNQLAYTYIIDQRGQGIIRSLGLMDEFKQVSAPNTNLKFNIVKKDGSLTSFGVPEFNPTRKFALWVTRRDMTRFFLDVIKRDYRDSIEIITGATVSLHNDNGFIDVSAGTQDNKIYVFRTNFVAGCDGLRSMVRQSLKDWHDDPARYTMVSIPSPSAGLRFKTLNLPPRLPLGQTGAAIADIDKMYVFRSAIKEKNRSLTMVVFPTRNETDPRTATFATIPGHFIWTIKTGTEMMKYLEEAFPQLAVKKIISMDEADRFASSAGGYFTEPQNSPGISYTTGSGKNHSAVVLCGDAIHAFPPDIGQGVNAALQDIAVLENALESGKGDIVKAAELYEAMRSDESRALVKIVSFAGPYQYKQDPKRGLIWQLTFFLQLALFKLLPRFFSAPVIVLAQNDQLTYTEVLSKLHSGINFNWKRGLAKK